MTHNQRTKPIQCHYNLSKEYINTVTRDSTVDSTPFLIYLQIKDNYFKVQLGNNLYLRVLYHEHKTKAQPLDNIQNHRRIQ